LTAERHGNLVVLALIVLGAIAWLADLGKGGAGEGDQSGQQTEGELHARNLAGYCGAIPVVRKHRHPRRSGGALYMTGTSSVSVRLKRRPNLSVTVSGTSMKLSSRGPQPATTHVGVDRDSTHRDGNEGPLRSLVLYGGRPSVPDRAAVEGGPLEDALWRLSRALKVVSHCGDIKEAPHG